MRLREALLHSNLLQLLQRLMSALQNHIKISNYRYWETDKTSHARTSLRMQATARLNSTEQSISAPTYQLTVTEPCNSVEKALCYLHTNNNISYYLLSIILIQFASQLQNFEYTIHVNIASRDHFRLAGWLTDLRESSQSNPHSNGIAFRAAPITPACSPSRPLDRYWSHSALTQYEGFEPFDKFSSCPSWHSVDCTAIGLLALN